MVHHIARFRKKLPCFMHVCFQNQYFKNMWWKFLDGEVPIQVATFEFQFQPCTLPLFPFQCQVLCKEFSYFVFQITFVANLSI